MEKTLNRSHNNETFIYGFSRLFERASYYGLRSLIVVYMVGETLKMSITEALLIYGWFTAAIVFSQILGALLGDLLIGGRWAMIIGGTIQAAGAFALCVPSSIALYMGLGLIALGNGLYSPNLIASFGKSYLDKTKLLDAGFMILYLMVSIGTFLGMMLLGYIGERFMMLGFIVAGILMLISVFLIYFFKSQSDKPVKIKAPINLRVLNILFTPILVAIFWAAYEMANIRSFDILMQFGETEVFGISRSVWSALGSSVTILFALIFAIIWSYFYSRQLVKMILGFLLGALSFGILFMIPAIPSSEHVPIYFGSIVVFSIAEIHTAPLLYSVLTKYANPKYLAILVALAVIPMRSFSYLSSRISENYHNETNTALGIGTTVLLVVAGALIIYLLLSRYLFKDKSNV
ncbi:MFS transporter [Sungkyunkwania multivorans]|uniref:MFS transporter n=1 Tax=Sungkyunkwania multivorans TaxID=1173618 RepID=A0ABW3D018_9FLAO